MAPILRRRAQPAMSQGIGTPSSSMGMSRTDANSRRFFDDSSLFQANRFAMIIKEAHVSNGRRDVGEYVSAASLRRAALHCDE